LNGQRRPLLADERGDPDHVGLDCIKGTYGSPCGAWSHEEATGWY
jgi:hypothetical protein